MFLKSSFTCIAICLASFLMTTGCESRPTALTSSNAARITLNEHEILDPPVEPKHMGGDLVASGVDEIIIHFTSDVIANADSPYDVERNFKIFNDSPAPISTHYLVARGGEIYRFVPKNRVAYHAVNHNSRSIGIEILAIGTEKEMTEKPTRYISKEVYQKVKANHPEFIGFTDKQYSSVKWLVSQLASEFPKIKADRQHVRGHEEVDPTRKVDPGDLFDFTKILP